MKSRGLLLAIAGCLAAATPAMAIPSRAMFAFTNSLQPTDIQLVLDGSTVVNAFDSGWYSNLGNHNASNKNYIAGVCGVAPDPCFGDDLNHHDFFAFTIPNGTYVSAALRLMNPPNGSNPQNGYISTVPTELYRLFGVETPLGALTATQSGQVGIFGDLGSGTLLGSRTVSAADNGTVVEITLNAAGLAAVNNAADGDWAIGGTLDPAAVPEPSTLLLLGAGLLAVGRRLRGHQQ